MEISERLRLPAEEKYEQELEILRKLDDPSLRPEGWVLSPLKVLLFIMGGPAKLPGGGVTTITPKFFGDPSIVETAIASLASEQALLLIGPPGTAKSLLSELLAAAISGSSRLIVQGSAGVTEDHLKYSWNYALLLKEGPTDAALKPSPVFEGMRRGGLVRIEELTRLVPEIQDVLISMLSEKEISIPEMTNRVLQARRGFNVIATANTLDKGVHQLSSALKRRFSFVHVGVVQKFETQCEIVTHRTRELLRDRHIPVEVPRDLVDLVVTLFTELRTGQSMDRAQGFRASKGDLSNAQAIAAVLGGCLSSSMFRKGAPGPGDLAPWVVRTVARDDASGMDPLREYVSVMSSHRRHARWPEFLEALDRSIKTLGEGAR